LILKRETGVGAATISEKIIPFPVEKYTDNSFLEILNQLLYSVTIQPMITPFLVLLFQLLKEK